MGSQRRLLTTGEDSGLKEGPNSMEQIKPTAEVAVTAEEKGSASKTSGKTQFETPGSSKSSTGQMGGLGFPSSMFTPKTGSSTNQVGQPPGMSKLSDLEKKINDLFEYTKKHKTVHAPIRELVRSIKSKYNAVKEEWKIMRIEAEAATKAKEQVEDVALETPKGRANKSSKKRDRDSPGEVEDSKKQRNEQSHDVPKDEEWQTVGNRKERRKKQDEDGNEKKKEGAKKPNSRPRRERSKGDAILIKANDQTSYAAILRKVINDPKLKDLGENVVKTRRTQQGEMLFELKKDPAIQSSAYQALIAESLVNEASVKALTQEAVVECRDLDEITTKEELQYQLQAQCELGEQAMAIRLTKSYDGTYTAKIRVPVATAKKMVEKGKVRIDWSVCPLSLVTRKEKRPMECFKCMDYGHMQTNCDGPDRSKLCRKCGEEGHFARDCKKRPKCMLCKPEDGNAHATGSFQCGAYKKAKAARQLRK